MHLHPKGSWWKASLLLAGTLVAVLAVFGSTVAHMIMIWSRSEAFGHCWFVFPIAGFMVWTNRRRLAAIGPRPSAWGLIVVVLAGAVWFLGQVASVQFLRQVGLVTMIIGAVWTVLGTRVARQIAYPLGFLYLAVPFGEALFPILIRLAGKAAAVALHAQGVPLAFDGRYLRLPGATWSISEACAGLHYLLSLLTVGAVFAYFTYRSSLKRAAFLAMCVVAALLTNGFRVWLVVNIGMVTNMQSPLVKDHNSLGWAIFAVMVVGLYTVGRRWADRDAGPSARTIVARAAIPPTRTALASLAVLGVAAGWSIYAEGLERRVAAGPPVALPDPRTASGWAPMSYSPWDWTPHYRGARASFGRVYAKNGALVGTYVAYYRDQRQRSELIQTGNGLLPPDQAFWEPSGETIRTVAAGTSRFRVGQIDLLSPGSRLRVWRWYWAGGRFAATPTEAKLLELRSKLLGRGDDAAVILLCAPFRSDPERASTDMTRFLDDMLPSLQATLQAAAAPPRT